MKSLSWKNGFAVAAELTEGETALPRFFSVSLSPAARKAEAMSSEKESGTETPLTPERWVEDHLDVLMGYALVRVRDRDVAEDLVQETLAGAWFAREQFKGRSNERTWLVGILKRKIVDHFRRQWRERPASEFSPDAEGDELVAAMFDEKGMWKDHRPQAWGDPGRALASKEFVDELWRCLDDIPPRLAEVFVLREMEQLSGKAVCQELKIRPTNLWQMMHRARLGLRLCLEKAGFGPRDERPE